VKLDLKYFADRVFIIAVAAKYNFWFFQSALEGIQGLFYLA